MYRLKNWSIRRSGSEWTAPELRSPILQGNVYGNPNFPDGAYITSSAIKKIDKTPGSAIVHTRSGSEYIIHATDVDPAYESLFPNAFGRLNFCHGCIGGNSNQQTKATPVPPSPDSSHQARQHQSYTPLQSRKDHLAHPLHPPAPI